MNLSAVPNSIPFSASDVLPVLTLTSKLTLKTRFEAPNSPSWIRLVNASGSMATPVFDEPTSGRYKVEPRSNCGGTCAIESNSPKIAFPILSQLYWSFRLRISEILEWTVDSFVFTGISSLTFKSLKKWSRLMLSQARKMSENV
ncbi:hypothetical protein OGAPHI_006376 [Ogataea philodendri]|uniref:Uncharacterized protein n=1 Tax=Ogataea philodendri TaxID=1378263 RepID=A0A9P8NX62_9ASCO|nr:uncharacterized protein OGAPHI_006376 [Ogataea philodendri]KAH3661528.1 hypothetical protein OGAPHI_006376 [Ogataea philodendri]